jgi:hypothetical protein
MGRKRCSADEAFDVLRKASTELVTAIARAGDDDR